MSDLVYVGKRLPRYDGMQHVTAQTRYVGDLSFPGMLHVKAWRSPVPSARINGVDVSAAQDLPGVVKVITHRDVPNNIYGFAKAETFVQAMYKAGKSPTRAGLMNALLSLNFKNKFSLPGVVMKTTKRDHFIISQMELQRFNNGVWSKIGPLVQARPR